MNFLKMRKKKIQMKFNKKKLKKNLFKNQHIQNNW